MTTRTLTFKLFEKRLCMALVVAAVSLAVLYSYFLVTSIVNVIVREEAEQSIARINSELSDLEHAYIRRQDVVDIELAYRLGFTEVEHKQFVTRRGALEGGLTFGNEI